jgi:hypothetical protein
VIAAPVPLELARARLPAGLTAVAVAPGHSLGGVLLARYREGSTLHYDELIVFSGLARRGPRLGFWVSHIWVDLAASVAGGREIWALPKEEAAFAWAPRGEVVVSRAGRTLLEARLPRAARRAPLPLLAPMWSARDGALLHTVSAGRLRGSAGRPTFHAPGQSPVSELGHGPPVLGLTGTMDLSFPAPRRCA